MITLLCHGCPVQAIVAAFGLDERTVADWRDRAGRHGQRIPRASRPAAGRSSLGHVQADELFVKVVGRRLWMAMAMAVPSRLWLGGVVSPRRDLSLITAVVQMVRRPQRAWRSWSVSTAWRATSRPSPGSSATRCGRAGPGRPRLAAIPGLLLGQVIKHHRGRRLVSVTRRAVPGTAEAIAAVLAATGTGTGINTSYIERLNATFRGAMPRWCAAAGRWPVAEGR